MKEKNIYKFWISIPNENLAIIYFIRPLCDWTYYYTSSKNKKYIVYVLFPLFDKNWFEKLFKWWTFSWFFLLSWKRYILRTISRSNCTKCVITIIKMMPRTILRSIYNSTLKNISKSAKSAGIGLGCSQQMLVWILFVKFLSVTPSEDIFNQPVYIFIPHTQVVLLYFPNDKTLLQKLASIVITKYFLVFY